MFGFLHSANKIDHDKNFNTVLSLKINKAQAFALSQDLHFSTGK